MHGLTSERIGEVAAREHIVLDELTPQKASLEEAFMALTGDAVEYRADDHRTRHRDWSTPHEPAAATARRGAARAGA